MLNKHIVTKYCYDVGRLVYEVNGKLTRNVVVSQHKGGKTVNFG